MESSKNENLLTQFNHFKDYCQEILHAYYTFNELGKSSELLLKIAPSFFGDLNKILICNFYLQTAKLGDNEKFHTHENLSIRYFTKKLNLENNQKFKDVVKPIDNYITKIKPARNKIITHNDLSTVVNGEIHGETTEEELIDFITALPELCNFLAEVINTPITDISYTGHPGDVKDFTRYIERLGEPPVSP